MTNKDKVEVVEYYDGTVKANGIQIFPNKDNKKYENT